MYAWPNANFYICPTSAYDTYIVRQSASEQGCTRPSCRRLTALESAVAKGTGEMVDTVFPRGGGDGRAGADAKRPSPQIAEILGL